MSADNWAVCPKCSEKMREKRTKAIRKAEESYGKVPLEEFQASLEKAKDMPEEPPNTLREDYGIGTDEDGTFSVSYSCHCGECGLTFEFKEEKQVC